MAVFSQSARALSAGYRLCFLTAAVLSLFFVACSKSKEAAQTSPKEASKVSGSKAQTAKIPEGAMVVEDITPGIKGGKLVMGNPGDPKTFNPPLGDDNVSQKIASYLFDGLYGYDAYKQEDKPALAKSWEYNEATLEWTFHLRPDLKWSDGESLTSDDVLFYTEVIQDEKVPTAEREFMKSGGKFFIFSAPDPLTFVVKIPEADSFAWLSLGLIKPLPRHKYGQALKEGKFAEILGTNSKAEDCVGSGPFKLKEFKSGEKVVLQANPYYYEFDSAGTRLPYVNEILLLNVEDYNALALRFQAGDLDLTEDILPSNLPVIQDGQEKGNYTLYSPGMRLGSTNLWFNLKPGGTYEGEGGKRVAWTPPTPDATPPPEIMAKSFRPYVPAIKLKWFENEDFRKACSMAANRDAMVKTILFGEGEAVYGHEGEANKKWNNPNVPKFPYDPAKAAELLQKIGFIDRDGDGIREDPQGNPIRFTIVTNKENDVREKIGVLMKEDMVKLGFDVTLQILDFNDIVTKTGDTYDYEACLLGLGSGTPPHPAMGRNVWLTSGRMHEWNPNQKTPATPWEAKLDELYGSLQKVFKYEEQKKIYDDMQVIWSEHQALIHLVTQKVYVAASNKIGNLKPTVLDPHLTHNIAELYIKK